METLIKKWQYAFSQYFLWEKSSSEIEKILLSLCFAFLTGVSAQIRIVLPFTPVPITGQVLFVLLSGVILGKNAYVSQIFYLAGGTIIPWFQGANFLSIGVTTGYIIGFIPSAWIVGYLLEKESNRNFLRIAGSMGLGIFIIHFCGIMWLQSVIKFTVAKAIMLGTVPFVFPDIIKACMAVAIANKIMPSKFVKIHNKPL